MQKTVIVLCAFAVGLLPNFAHAKMGRCIIQVKQKIYLDGQCEIGFNDKEGSFTIGVGEKSRSKYFAYVNIEEDGAHGYWNQTPDASHAQASLGILKQHGACWENNMARLCAFK